MILAVCFGTDFLNWTNYEPFLSDDKLYGLSGDIFIKFTQRKDFNTYNLFSAGTLNVNSPVVVFLLVGSIQFKFFGWVVGGNIVLSIVGCELLLVWVNFAYLVGTVVICRDEVFGEIDVFQISEPEKAGYGEFVEDIAVSRECHGTVYLWMV